MPVFQDGRCTHDDAADLHQGLVIDMESGTSDIAACFAFMERPK